MVSDDHSIKPFCSYIFESNQYNPYKFDYVVKGIVSDF